MNIINQYRNVQSKEKIPTEFPKLMSKNTDSTNWSQTRMPKRARIQPNGSSG